MLKPKPRTKLISQLDWLTLSRDNLMANFSYPTQQLSIGQLSLPCWPTFHVTQAIFVG